MKTSTQVYASSYPKSWLCSPRWLPVFHVICPPTVGWGCHRAGSSQRLRILRFNQEEGTLMQLKYRSARWRSRGNLLPSPSLGWPLHCRCDRRGFAPPVKHLLKLFPLPKQLQLGEFGVPPMIKKLQKL